MTYKVKVEGDIGGLIRELRYGIANAVRPAAQAGAQVLYDSAKDNVARIATKTGRLSKSIYQRFMEKESIEHPDGGYIKAVYEVSYRASDAPHALWLEYGFVMRYQSVQLKDGDYITLIRPEAVGKKRPGRRASQADKDAYYVKRKKGPLHVAAQPFMRPVKYKIPVAKKAITSKFTELVNMGAG